MTTPDSIPCAIHLEDPTDGRDRTQGYLEVPRAGTVVIDLVSPRPLRLWVGDLPVLDEDLWWRRFERWLRAFVTLPMPAGAHRLHAVYWPLPLWPSVLDEQCPSRNRERVRQELRERRPDRFKLAAAVQPGAAAIACNLRVIPAQCVIGGVTFQHVLARQLTVAREDPPATSCDHPGTRPRWELGLRSALAPYHARDASDAADRAAGVQRFLVPVANRVQPLPMARGEDGVEDRLEPECAVVASLRFTIEPVLAAFPDERTAFTAVAEPVVAELPVHEARGRLAALREHIELRWPGEDELLAKVPRPILPGGAAGFSRLHEYAWRMLLRLRRAADPRSGLPNDYVGASCGGFLNEMHVWDSSFTAMCTAWGWRNFPYAATLDCLYSRQMDGGYLHREIDVREGAALCWEPDFSPNPPLSVIAEWKIASLTGDAARLAAVYPVLSAQHRWIRRNRRLSDGTYWTTGLANGLDNSPSLGEGYPDLTAQQAHAAETLGYIATSIGLAGDAEAFQKTDCIWENYCAERSERGSWSMPDYAWTALGPIALLYEVLIGVRPDALHKRIRWTLPEAPGWGLERIPLGPATIDLCLLDGRRISIANDRTFILELEDAARVRSQRIPAGRWVVAIDDIAVISDRTIG